MKKSLKTTIAAMAMAALFLAGCGNGAADNSSAAGSVAAPSEGTVKTVAISQFAQHESLDDCREGFLLGLKEGGFEEGKNLKIKEQNAQADPGIANQIANQFAADKPDLACGIATISAQSLYNACEKVNVPVIYTAVSDPIAAGLAKKDGSSVGHVTGTSDKLPLEAQVKMIRALMPEAKKIGVLYSTSEVNSESHIKELEKICPKYGFELVAVGISTVQDIPAATDNILGKVDCLNNLTDNTVVNALDVVMEKANAKKIPVFGSEIDQLKKGCLASMSIDYVDLGKETGKMAAKVLKGEDITKMPFLTIDHFEMVYNKDVAAKYGITIPEDMDAKAV